MTIGYDENEMLAKVQEALGFLADGGRKPILAPLLYRPDRRLEATVRQLKPFVRGERKCDRTAGVLLEQVATMAFGGLVGWDVLKSYQSLGPQIDLLINGNDAAWLGLCRFVRMDEHRRGILVEAKAVGKSVGDSIFARLCALSANMETTVSLAVLFTLNGASGFPKEGGKEASLRHARLRQVLHHSRTRTPVIVFDWDDIVTLKEPGSLPRIIERKIRDIEELSVWRLPKVEHREVDLPKHLTDIIDKH